MGHGDRAVHGTGEGERGSGWTEQRRGRGTQGGRKECDDRRARELSERGGVLGERERGRPRGEVDAQHGLGQRGGSWAAGERRPRLREGARWADWAAGKR